MFTELEADDDGVSKIIVLVSEVWLEVCNFKTYAQNSICFRQFQMFLRE